MPAAKLINRLGMNFAARDWHAMRALYHPDALVFTVTGGPQPFPADTVIDELARVANDSIYNVTADPPIALDEHAAIITGRMRRRTSNGGYEDASHTWLITVKDELVYRQAIYSNGAAATAAYAELGLNLGVDPAADGPGGVTPID